MLQHFSSRTNSLESICNVPKNAIEIDVMAWQWGWQYRLPGEDGKLGTTQVVNINDDNPFGINLDDPYGKMMY